MSMSPGESMLPGDDSNTIDDSNMIDDSNIIATTPIIVVLCVWPGRVFRPLGLPFLQRVMSTAL